MSAELVGAFRALLADRTVDGAFKAFAISLPADTELLASITAADPLLLFGVRAFVVERVAAALQAELRAAVVANDDDAAAPYEFSAAACARRALKNKALGYLATLGDASVLDELSQRVATAANMTDEFSALAALDLAASSSAGGATAAAARAAAMQAFASKWAANPLVMLKWLTVQATSNAPNNVATLRAIMDDASKFTITNPNSCYSLLLAFARSAVNFHAADGSGYQFMGDCVLKVDAVNHQVRNPGIRYLVVGVRAWCEMDCALN